MLISYQMITIDRFEMTRDILMKNLERTNVPIELLVTDNGSEDKRIIDFIRSLNPAYHRVNSRNEGVSHSHNQMIIRGKGNYVFTAGNDIEMPQDWAEKLIELAERIPNCGLVGAHCGAGGNTPVTKKLGVEARWLTPQMDRVFGAWLFKRRIVDEIGWAHEGYGPYGMEDSDINQRLNLAGFNSCYHPTLTSSHHGWDGGKDTPYRKMKDESLAKNCTIYAERAAKFHDIGVREPLPPMREPL